MRVRPFAGAAVAVAVACASLACGKLSKGSGEKADVFVPEVDAEDEGGTQVPEAALPPGQVDRAGHALVTTLLVPGVLEDEYNELSTFDAGPPRTLQEALGARLVALDTLVLGDGASDPVDWPVPDGGTHPLLPMFLTDVLLVDTALSCSADGGFVPSYLDIEREIYLGASPHATCGGRTPNENVVDETLTLVVTGGRIPVTQGVAAPSPGATTTFPYLAPPN